MVLREHTGRNSPFLVERRREPRVPQPGSVNVTFNQPDGAITFPAAVVDSSGGGMCIRHWRKELAIGHQVKISPASADGPSDSFIASVAWNWTVGPVVMSGLEKCAAEQTRHNSSRSFANSRLGRTSSILWACATVLAFVLGWFFTRIW
jgi:hypothetical protein